MTDKTRDLFNQVLDLPEDMRHQLVDEVLASFKSPSTDEVERAWVSVAKRRLAEIRSGKVQTISAEEADARCEARIAAIRKAR